MNLIFITIRKMSIKQIFLLFTYIFTLVFSHKTLSCGLCHLSFGLFQKFLQSDFVKSIGRQVRIAACNKDPKICPLYFDNNDFMMIHNFALRFQPDILCAKLNFCDDSYVIEQNFEDYKREILYDKPPHKPKKHSDKKPLKIGVITDIHLDLNYTTSKSANCGAEICCRNDSPDIKSEADRPGKWGHVGYCDLNYLAFNSFVENLQANHKDLDLIVWLGDNPADAFYRIKELDHKKVFNNITETIKKYYPSLGQIYPLLGNHEGIPLDQMNMDINSSHWPIDYLSELWSHWLTPESKESFKKFGRYSQLHPNTKLRIVALNSFTKDATNSFNFGNITDVWGELQWLYNVLKKAEINEESVLIIGHYPPLNTFIINEWAKRYLVLMDRFSDMVVGQFFGHVHEDTFQVEPSFSNPAEFSGIAFLHPAMTTNILLNPSYRVYEFDRESYLMLNYNQYRFNVSESNKLDKPIWKLAYRFTEYYDLPGILPEHLYELAKRILNNKEYFMKFALMSYGESPKSEKYMADLSKMHSTYCTLINGEQDELLKCMGLDDFIATGWIGPYILNHVWLPKWEYLIKK